MRLRTFVIAAVTMLLAAQLAQAGEAEDKARAKQHFETGLTLFKNENYAAAAGEFERSVDTYPTKNGLFNLANTYRALHRYGEALEVFDRLSRDFGDRLDDEMRANMDKQIAELDALIAWLTIEVEPDGATVVVDERKQGTSPLEEPLVLGAGEHVVEVSLEGYQTSRERVALSPGEKASVSVTLAVVEPEVPPEPEEEPEVPQKPPAEADGKHPLFWIGMSGTIAAGLTAGAFWGLTADYASRYEDQVDAYDPLAEEAQRDYTRLKDRRSKTVTFNRVAIGASIATGVFAATMVLGIVLGPDDDEDEASPVEVTAAPGGVQVRF